VRLAIWGSCATRDVLEVGEHPFEVDYHARTSWVSQASVSGQTPVPVPDGAGFGARMVREDLTKEVVTDLVANQPDVLVIDLIDERFDVIRIEQSCYTMSDYYERLGLEPALREVATHATSSNEALAAWYASLRSAFGRRLQILEAPRDLLVGDPAHRWGLAHYHYDPEYYTWILTGLHKVADGKVAPRWAARRPASWAPGLAEVAV